MNKNYQQKRTSKFNFDVPRGWTIEGDRQAYTHDDLYDRYPLLPKRPPSRDEGPTRHTIGRFLESLFPVVKTLRRYRISYVLSDLVAAVSVSFLHVPQGLAYGLLASLTPVTGLYTSLIPVIMYTLFGTCMHISMGTNSILSLITAELVERELKVRDDEKKLDRDNMTIVRSDAYLREATDFKLGVAMLSTFVCGTILLAMGIFRLGFLTSYMPSSFVGGFTTAASIHIATSQVGKALHIHVTPTPGWGRVLKTYIIIFDNITSANMADLLICLITLSVIAIFSLVNRSLKARRYRFDVPINLVVVILGTFASYFFAMEDRFGIDAVGDVATGFPSPHVPDFSLALNVLQDSVIMAMVVFSMTISMAILMSKVHNYEIDANQELIAYGLCNISASPFMCHANSVSPARTMMLSNTQVKSMLHGIPTAFFLLLVILGMGHLFRDLPIAVLSAVVLGAVWGLLVQVKQVPRLWRLSKADFWVWVATFLVTAFVDIGVGIIVGILVAVFGVVVANQKVDGEQMVRGELDNLFIVGEDRRDVTVVMGIRIFYFPTGLYFFNAEIFKRQLFERVLDPSKVGETIYHLTESDKMFSKEDSSIRCIVIDCSAMTSIDYDGLSMLKMIVLSYHRVGVQILLTRCHPDMFDTLERGSFFSILPRSCVFYDLRDAITYEQVTREGVSVLALTGSTPISLDQFESDVSNDTSTVEPA